MALNLNTTYPSNTDPANADYPLGRARNSTTPTSTDGFPGDTAWFLDFSGFFQGLLSRTGITASGVSDTVLVSDYLDGLIDLTFPYARMRAEFNYVSTTQITMTGGVYPHRGSENRILRNTSTALTHTLTGVGTSELQYIYIDDSTLTSSVLSNPNIINSTTAPTFSAAKNGFYNGDDQCIFAVMIDGSGNIVRFYHEDDYVSYNNQPDSASGSLTSGTWETINIVDGIPSFCRRINTTVTLLSIATNDQFLWRTNTGDSGHIFLTTASGRTETVTLDVHLNLSRVYQLLYNATSGTTLYLAYLNGFYLPSGL